MGPAASSTVAYRKFERTYLAYSVEKLCFRRQFWSGEVAAKSIVLIRATKKWARKRP